MSRSTIEYFEEEETNTEYNGYFYSVGEALTLVILGSICGLRNVSQIHQWASNERTKIFLKEQYGIAKVPSYYWMQCLLKIIKPQSLSECFMRWAQSLVPEGVCGKTVPFDGKTIRSTEKMGRYEQSLHIISAQIAEMGITFGQYPVQDKSNEIPAVRELVSMLEIKGCTVVADALHCQKDTAKAIRAGEADYVLSVKDNQPALKTEIAEYIQEERLRQAMDSVCVCEKNRERIERRSAFTASEIRWLAGREQWEGLGCIGAVHTEVQMALLYLKPRLVRG